MTHQTLKTLVVITLAGTTLSGCSLVGSAADTAWGGTKTVAKWVSAPVRYVLRGTPEVETQFAGVEAETDVVEADSETTEILVAEAETTKAEPMSATVTTVSESRVVAAEPIMQTAQTSVTTSTSYQSTSTVRMASAADFSSSAHYSIQTTDGSGIIHFVRLQGESNVADWMDCNTNANGYWITSASGGHVNPAFEVCMRNMDYVLKTELDSYDTAEIMTDMADLKVSPVATSNSQTTTMAGGVSSTKTQTTSASYVALPVAQSAALPDKF